MKRPALNCLTWRQSNYCMSCSPDCLLHSNGYGYSEYVFPLYAAARCRCIASSLGCQWSTVNFCSHELTTQLQLMLMHANSQRGRIRGLRPRGHFCNYAPRVMSLHGWYTTSDTGAIRHMIIRYYRRVHILFTIHRGNPNAFRAFVSGVFSLRQGSSQPNPILHYIIVHLHRLAASHCSMNL